MCTVLLPPGVNSVAVDKYTISYHIISYHIISYLHRLQWRSLVKSGKGLSGSILSDKFIAIIVSSKQIATYSSYWSENWWKIKFSSIQKYFIMNSRWHFEFQQQEMDLKERHNCWKMMHQPPVECVLCPLHRQRVWGLRNKRITVDDISKTLEEI